MLLLLGDSADFLSLEVLLRCDEAGLGREKVVACDEKTLFEALPFALRMDHSGCDGCLVIQGGSLALEEISAVLFRPQRWWWPPEEFDLQDQMFVYHETMASWFAICSALRCPVVNRFGLGWWLQDLNYPRQLALGFSDALGLALSLPPASGGTPYGRLLPAGPPDPVEAQSLYIAGPRLVPTSACSPALIQAIAGRRSALAGWQDETGITLCRADFTPGDTPRLRHLEVFPRLEDEERTVTEELAGALFDALMRPKEVRA